MTFQEFKSIIDQCNTFEELAALRHKTGAPAFVAQIKEKISKILKANGYKYMCIGMSVLKTLTKEANAGDQGTFVVPQTSLKFKEYRCQTIHYYVNGKVGAEHAHIYFKVV